MRFSQAYRDGSFSLSFELFPPKTEAGHQSLFNSVAELVKLQPAFITCTYGAGGSTRDKTLQIAQQVREQFHLPVAAHLTCVGSTVEQLRSFLSEAAERGIENIVALRGDPPRGETGFRPVEGGLKYANELVALIRSEFGQFGVAVAGYPETHQEAPGAQVDLENLKRKVDCGADVVITQLYYDNADFFRFRESCDRVGIDVPIVPGLLPITNFAQVKRITALCGAKLPADLVQQLEAAGEDRQRQFELGVDQATRQTQQLVDAGVPGIHFYVLNKSRATKEVLSRVSM